MKVKITNVYKNKETFYNIFFNGKLNYYGFHLIVSENYRNKHKQIYTSISCSIPF